MANFFKDGFSKLQGHFQELVAGSARPDSSSPTQQQPLPYTGRLSAGSFCLSEGSPLGLGVVVPQTLAFEPRAQLIGICTPEGHVRLFGQDLELCLCNPVAPVQPEFLLFPRPGLLLTIGIASGSHATRGNQKLSPGTWLAQWWDLRSGESRPKLQGPGGIQPPQLLTLRFSVVCAAVSEGNTDLVFFGTDEGDVRVFDAGDSPHMGAYCIPWDKLFADKHRPNDARPCPVLALAPLPNATTELLVGGAEGGIVLWSFEKNRPARNFMAAGAVISLVWHSDGTAFLAASRADISIFSKSSSTKLASVPLPGGPASSVKLLRWCEAVGDVAKDHNSAKPGDKVIRGELLLKRGTPNPTVLSIWGPEWSQMENLFSETESSLAGAVLVTPAVQGGAQSADCEFSCATVTSPCGCMAPPWNIMQKDLLAGTPKRSALFERLSAASLILAALGDPSTRLMMRTIPPMRPLAWPATWGSLELVGVTAFELIPKSEDVGWPRMISAAVAARSEADVERPIREPLFAVKEGCLLDGVTAVPNGKELETNDGWLACSADENAPASGEGVNWALPADLPVTNISCKLSLGEGANVVLAASGEFGADMITIDAMTGCAICHGACGSSQCNIEIQPGEEHELAIVVEDGHRTFMWDNVAFLGPVSFEGSLSRLLIRSSGGRHWIRSLSCVECTPKADLTPEPARNPIETLAEAMFARRFAHFAGFASGGELEPESWQFVDSWNSMVGGWQGLLCTGHRDGTIRLWLRAHAAVLLLHTVSLRPCSPLPWRPQLTSGGDAPQLKPAQRSGIRWYDGVDACPAVVTEEDESALADSTSSMDVSAVVFQPLIGMLAAGTSQGNVALFRWTDVPVPLPISEYAEWKLRSLLPEPGDVVAGVEPDAVPDAAPAQSNEDHVSTRETDEHVQQVPSSGECLEQGVDAASVCESLMLPAGFVCMFRLRQHTARVTQLRLVVTSAGNLHLVSTDTASCLCIADARSGAVLYFGSLDSHVRDPLPASLDGVDSSTLCSPGAPPDTVEGVVLANGMLRAASTNLEQQPITPVAQISGFLDPTLNSGVSQGADTYILVLSSGEIRQLTAREMCVLDNRIRETRLPQIPCGVVIRTCLCPEYLLIVQRGAVHVFLRPTPAELSAPHSEVFTPHILSANTLVLDDEQCLCVVFVDLSVRFFALPGLQEISTLSSLERATRLLGAMRVLEGGGVSDDGYIMLRGCGLEGGQLWWASLLTSTSALDEATRLVPAAYIAQTTRRSSAEATASRGASASAGPRGGAGLLSNLFGSGPRTLRECIAPVGTLPNDVDAARIDRSRGLPPAWSNPTAVPPPPPPPPPPSGASSSRSAGSQRTPAQSQSSAVSSAKAEIAQAHARTMERGEKLSEISQKAQQLSDDSNNFLKMAKQLNEKQNRWF